MFDHAFILFKIKNALPDKPAQCVFIIPLFLSIHDFAAINMHDLPADV